MVVDFDEIIWGNEFKKNEMSGKEDSHELFFFNEGDMISLIDHA